MAKKLLLLALFAILLALSVNALEYNFYCYQETPNVSTSCGGLSTGEYNLQGSLISPCGVHDNTPSNYYDGNWSSYIVQGCGGHCHNMTMVYQKPPHALNTSLWQVKYHSFDTYTINWTIPAKCWEEDNLTFHVSMSDGGGCGMDTGTYIECYNGTGWDTFNDGPYQEAYNTNQFFEEAMFWNMAIVMNITNCSTGDVILNFSLYDENNLSAIYGDIEAELEITTDTGEALNYYNSASNASYLSFCLTNLSYTNVTPFNIDVTASYIADNYAQEYWFLDDGDLNSSCQFNSYTDCQVELYDLLLTDSTTFLFSFEDEYGLEVDDAIILTNRQYIGDGIFREIERSRQDENGETHMHLIEEDAIYYFTVTQYGEIVYTSGNYHAKCLSSPCAIALDAGDEFTAFSTDWENIDGTYYSFANNKTARTTILTFVSNATDAINFTLYSYNNNEPTLINSSALTASSGNIELTVPLVYGNTSFFTSIYKNGEFVRSQWVNFNYNAQDYFGVSGAILSAMIIMALGLMAIAEGVAMVIIVVVALFLMGIMMLIDLNWLAVVSLLCAGGIIIWKIIKNRRGN